MRSGAFASLRLITISISFWQDSWVGRSDFALGRDRQCAQDYTI